ncbi:MAG TPA: hypothetical protein VL332_11775 [Candidatus Saccharimonadaceae bacterium]|nr:hypothetical protein [Candidatus Saccharimonadaceae bacterium]
MRPSRRVRWCALTMLAALALGAMPAHAQDYEDTRRALGLSPDPIERSPRLLGMGGVTLLGDEPHNRITLWDFAGFPTGINADSQSVIELRPRTSSGSDVRDFSATDNRERQTFAMRENGLGFEFWNQGPTTYGAIGDFAGVRQDQPYAEDTEWRHHVTQPSITPIVSGTMPYTSSGRTRYALRVIYASEVNLDDYLTIVPNAAGQYIDQQGEELNPPNFFTPDQVHGSKLGGGVAASQQLSRSLTLGVGADFVGNRIHGENSADRYSAETHEKRGVNQGQVALIGRVGSHFQWGLDGRAWTSSSQEDWNFSLSAGTTAPTLDGRGKLLDRDENGTSGRARVRLATGSLEWGASFDAYDRKVTVTPPDASDLTSFNHFLTIVYNRAGGDTLSLPDSIVHNEVTSHTWNGAVGVNWRLGRGVWALEYHKSDDREEQTVANGGPEATTWDVRTGLDWELNRVVSGRIGYQYASIDLDKNTEQNEWISNGISLGLGLRPAGASWSFDSGYLIQWNQADYGSPVQPRGSRQRLATRVHWDF